MTFRKASKNLRHALAFGCMHLLSPKLLKTFQNTIESEIRKTQRVPRPSMSFLAQCIDKDTLIGIEIGVYRGINAESIFQLLPIKHLYLVDPYSELHNPVKDFPMMQAYQEMRKRLRPFSDRITLIRHSSKKAIHYLPPQVDFTYIDGDHSYDAIKTDLKLYYPKTRLLLAGHDFNYGHSDVQQAVTEFAREENLPLHVQIPDFWFLKTMSE